MVVSALFGIAPPWLIKNVVDDVLIRKQMNILNLIAIGVVVLYMFKAVFGYAHMYLMTWVGQKVVIDIRLANSYNFHTRLRIESDTPGRTTEKHARDCCFVIF